MSDLAKSTFLHRLMAGFAWQGAGRISERMLRFGVNIILARMLTTDDFGLFAAVLAPMAAIETFTFLSTGPFIIHNERGRQPGLLRSVLLLNIIRGLFLCLLILAFAPLVSEFFDRPGIRSLLIVMSIQPLLAGFMSPRVHVLEKDLKFKPVAVNGLIATIFGCAVALFVAMQSPSVWALVCGRIAFTSASLVGSWIIAPMNPFMAPDFTAFKRLRRYALAAFGTPVLIMAIGQAPAILIGRLDSMESLGVFALTYRLAELPVFLSLSVIGSVLIPAYSKLQNDISRLRRVWLQAWSAIGITTLPLALLVAWSGDALPRLVWGSDYVTERPLVPVLALVGFLSAMLAITGPLFWGVGRPGIDRLMQLVRVIVVYGLGVTLALNFGAEGVGWSLAAGLIGALFIGISGALGIVKADLKTLIRSSSPFILAGLSLAVLLYVIDTFFEPEGFERLTWSGTIGLIWATILFFVIFLRRGGINRFA